MSEIRTQQLPRDRRTQMDRVWLPFLRPETHTFPAFVERGTGGGGVRKPVPKSPEDVHADRLVIAVLAGIVLGLIGACTYGAFFTHTDQWAFDRPEAKLPPPQSHHSPYLR
jgi:hypothetical protein